MEMKNFTITKRDGSKDRFSLDKIMNAILKAFIILARENRSFDPSRFVIVKFLISIAYFIFLGVYNSFVTVYYEM